MTNSCWQLAERNVEGFWNAPLIPRSLISHIDQYRTSASRSIARHIRWICFEAQFRLEVVDSFCRVILHVCILQRALLLEQVAEMTTID